MNEPNNENQTRTKDYLLFHQCLSRLTFRLLVSQASSSSVGKLEQKEKTSEVWES